MDQEEASCKHARLIPVASVLADANVIQNHVINMVERNSNNMLILKAHIALHSNEDRQKLDL